MPQRPNVPNTATNHEQVGPIRNRLCPISMERLANVTCCIYQHETRKTVLKCNPYNNLNKFLKSGVKILWYSFFFFFFGVLLLNMKVCIFIPKAIKYMDVTGIMSYMPTFRARKQIFQFQAEVWCCYFGRKKNEFHRLLFLHPGDVYENARFICYC